jgi:transposase
VVVLTLPPTVRIYVAAEPVDLRRGFDGLAAATRQIIREEPLSGHLFCFLNRRANRLKILLWQPSGFLMLYKRLEHGRFKLPQAPLPGRRHIEMESTDLALMMEGIDLRDARRRKRWAPQNILAPALSM